MRLRTIAEKGENLLYIASTFSRLTAHGKYYKCSGFAAETVEAQARFNLLIIEKIATRGITGGWPTHNLEREYDHGRTL